MEIISEQPTDEGKSVFVTRETAASFITDRHDEMSTINSECRDTKGCSYVEVLENNIPDVVSISNIMSYYQELFLI